MAEFHQFYESVLGLYQPKHEHDDASVAAKLEVLFVEGNAAQPDGDGPSSDDSNDGGAVQDWFDDSFHKVNIKQEEIDALVESGSSDTPPKRERRRPLKAMKLSTRDDETKAKQTKHSQKNDYSGNRSNLEIATYFTLKCDLCDEKLSNLTFARNHYQNVHEQPGYLICGCGRRFTRIDAIRDHCAFHADPSPHKCTECDKVYKNVGRLAAHNKAKHPTTEASAADDLPAAAPGPDDTSHPVSSASTAVTSPGPSTSLVQIRRSEDELIRRYMSMACTLCDKGGKKPFESFKKLRQHQRQVHGQKSYLECCGKRFVLKCRAVEHCQWHENPQQFE